MMQIHRSSTYFMSTSPESVPLDIETVQEVQLKSLGGIRGRLKLSVSAMMIEDLKQALVGSGLQGL